MAMVKDRLIFESKKMEAFEQRKSNREQKLRAKEKHAEAGEFQAAPRAHSARIAPPCPPISPPCHHHGAARGEIIRI